MSTQEYYIRKADETDARGPFTLEQLSSLAENGQTDADTYYYDAGSEAWTPISANPALMETLFPTKRPLRMKAQSASEVKTLNPIGTDQPGISVNDMLLAAEGRTPDTKNSADPAINQARAAGIGLYSGMAILFITAAAYILPGIDIVLKLDWAALLQSPLPFFGLLNLALAICLALGATAAYPTVRFAATLGLGFTAALFHLQGHPLPLACAAAAAIGLYFCTILLNLPGVILAALAGVGGSLGLALHLFTH